MVTNARKFALGFMILTQMAVLFAVATLEYLSDQKMGVMRYLLFKNAYYDETIFNSDHANVYKFILVALILISFLALLGSFIKIKIPKITMNIFSVMLLKLLVYIFISLKAVIELKAYYFFMIAFLIILVIEYIKLFLNLMDLIFVKRINENVSVGRLSRGNNGFGA